MPSLMVQAEESSGSEVPQGQKKDDPKPNSPKPVTDEGVALSPSTQKDAKRQSGNSVSPKGSRLELAATAAPLQKSVKSQNGVKHQSKSLKLKNAQVTVPKKNAYHSRKDPQAQQLISSDSAVQLPSEAAIQEHDKAENLREHVFEAVKSEKEFTSEHEMEHPSGDVSRAVGVEGEILETSCLVTEGVQSPCHPYMDQASEQLLEQTDAWKTSTQDKDEALSSQSTNGQADNFSSKVSDACFLKDASPSHAVGAAASPLAYSSEEKLDQSTTENNLLNVIKDSSDAPLKLAKPVMEKILEKTVTPKGLKRSLEKSSKVSSTDLQSTAKPRNSLSPSQKSSLAGEPEKSPKTPPQTPSKSSSSMKVSKVSPESACVDAPEEKEDIRKGPRKGASEKPPGKPLVSTLKSRKSRLGQGGNTANEQQIQGSEVEDTIYGAAPSVNSKHQHSQQSTLGKGQLLLKMAKLSYASGDNPQKAFDHATRAVKFFEGNTGNSSCLELVMSLHILAAVHCTMGQYEEAILVLQRSLVLLSSDLENPQKAPDADASNEPMLAMFSGHMQLGDTFVLAGMNGKALDSYHTALEIQRQTLGEMDPLVGDTCRYLSEAHLQALQFQEAEEMCQHVLKIHSENSSLGSLEEATDRRLMALILSSKGEHEAALEHLVFASTALSSSGKEVEVAAVDCCIGDAYIALGRFDEALFAYQKALTVIKSAKGETHASVGAILVNLAEVSLKTGKQREAKSYAENALRIYGKHGSRHALDELAIGLTEVAAVFDAINEREQALCLLRRALDILEKVPGEQTSAAGVEAQMGVLYFVMGKPSNAFTAFKNAVLNLRAASEKNTALVGALLNQMGLACIELQELAYASQVFQEAQLTLEEACGPHHPDTLAVRSNLAAVYDAQGRVDDAISILESILEVKEERLGTAHRDVEDERQRLMVLLREVGRPRNRKTNTLEQLLTLPLVGSHNYISG